MEFGDDRPVRRRAHENVQQHHVPAPTAESDGIRDQPSRETHHGHRYGLKDQEHLVADVRVEPVHRNRENQECRRMIDEVRHSRKAGYVSEAGRGLVQHVVDESGIKCVGTQLRNAPKCQKRVHDGGHCRRHVRYDSGNGRSIPADRRRNRRGVVV